MSLREFENLAKNCCSFFCIQVSEAVENAFNFIETQFWLVDPAAIQRKIEFRTLTVPKKLSKSHFPHSNKALRDS
jgi:hypothetical protein